MTAVLKLKGQRVPQPTSNDMWVCGDKWPDTIPFNPPGLSASSYFTGALWLSFLEEQSLRAIALQHCFLCLLSHQGNPTQAFSTISLMGPLMETPPGHKCFPQTHRGHPTSFLFCHILLASLTSTSEGARDFHSHFFIPFEKVHFFFWRD